MRVKSNRYFGALGIALSVVLVTPAAHAARLGGAYYVDDAEIGSVGSCEVESWGSFAANGDRVMVFNPACVYNLGRPVEIGMSLIGLRAGGEWSSIFAASAKTVLAKQQGIMPGIAVAGVVTYDLRSGSLESLILNVPFTWDLSKTVRVNVNAGAQYNAREQVLFPLGGLGVSWNFLPKWSVIAETFAIMAPQEANPRWQSGVRYSPAKDVDCDIVYGRNITGERSNWLTLALTMRLGDR
jgi:hypothetical protein